MNGITRQNQLGATLVLLLILLLVLSIPSTKASGEGSYKLNLPIVHQESPYFHQEQECPPGMFFYPPANACIVLGPPHP